MAERSAARAAGRQKDSTGAPGTAPKAGDTTCGLPPEDALAARPDVAGRGGMGMADDDYERGGAPWRDDACALCEEYRFLLQVLGSEAEVWKSLQQQFGIVTQRTQMVFGVGALAISVAGFSGHRLAAAGPFSGLTLMAGLVCILVGLFVALYGVVRVRWMSSLRGDTVEASFLRLLAVRNRKTRYFLWSLKLVIVGLVLYVAALGWFLFRASLGLVPLV
ncbi:MAG TPA: hypothetical protein DEV75_09225 [Desulfovibrio sp.]|nr:hypothetical protein [Desulfovibrio sp.]